MGGSAFEYFGEFDDKGIRGEHAWKQVGGRGKHNFPVFFKINSPTPKSLGQKIKITKKSLFSPIPPGPPCFFHVWSHMHHGKKGSWSITRYPDTSSDMCTQNCTHCRRREKERGKRKNFLSFPNPLFPHFCNNPSFPQE